MVRPRLVEEGKPLSSPGFQEDNPSVVDDSLTRHHPNGYDPHYQHHGAAATVDATARASIDHPYAAYGPSHTSTWGEREVLVQTAAATAATSSSSSSSSPVTSPSSSLLKALARTQTDARQRQEYPFRYPPSSSQSHRTVIGECRGEESQESLPLRLPLPHQHHYAYQPAAVSSSLSATTLLPDPVQPEQASDRAISARPHQTHYEIGRMEEDDGRSHAEVDGDDDESMDDEMTGSDVAGEYVGLSHTRRAYEAAPASPVRMEGVEDHSIPVPLVVMDGANVAYDYGGVARLVRDDSGGDGFRYQAASLRAKGGAGAGAGAGAASADARGILVASEYFVRHGVRVKVVLPASWFRRKPTANDPNRSNARMQTDEQDALAELQHRGLLVASPPADDDDAYAIALARRESARAVQRCRALQQHYPLDPSSFPVGRMGGAFVLSNDMFRDAQDRDPTLRSWLTFGEGSVGPIDGGAVASSSLSHSASSGTCPGRISYTFVDVGTMDDRGDPQLDFLPNPRHPLISWLEERLRSQRLCTS